MPFRPTFDCLWCGKPWRATGEADLTGWASLCPDCLGRAQDNGFLRHRLREALRERSGGGGVTPRPAPALAAPPTPALAAPSAPALAAPPTPALAAPSAPPGGVPDEDDWYLRRGRYARGPALDLAWHADLDTATLWLDERPFEGTIVELAAGTGWWSPLLAGKGELTLYDLDPRRLDRARERLVAHGLRAHLHVRDPWAEPDRQVDGVFCGPWMAQVTDERLPALFALVMRWLRPGGRFAFIDPVDGPEPRVARRAPDVLADALRGAGFRDQALDTTTHSFVMGSAVTRGR